MASITNDYQKARVWDLGVGAEKRGPYLVTQTGYAIGDEEARESLFVLRPDGMWVDINVYLSSGRPEELDDAVFDSLAAVVNLFNGLPPQATVVDIPISEERLRAWLEDHPPGTLLEEARRWFARYGERRRVKQKRKPSPGNV